MMHNENYEVALLVIASCMFTKRIAVARRAEETMKIFTDTSDERWIDYLSGIDYALLKRIKAILGDETEIHKE